MLNTQPQQNKTIVQVFPHTTWDWKAPQKLPINIFLWKSAYHPDSVSNGLGRKVGAELGTNHATVPMGTSYLPPNHSCPVGFATGGYSVAEKREEKNRWAHQSQLCTGPIRDGADNAASLRHFCNFIPQSSLIGPPSTFIYLWNLLGLGFSLNLPNR